MFQLFVGESKNHVPVIPVRWCLSKELIQELSNAGAQNPHILLSIFYNNEDEEGDCVAVPLTQVMTFVEFNRPGQHRIEANIVWWDPNQINSLKVLQRRSENDSRYRIGLIRERMGEDRTSHLQFGGGKYFYFHKEIAIASVTVDEGFFAGDPPEWEREWVNFWFSHNPKDQCEFRRRRLVAYTIQPPVLLFWVVFSVITRSLFALYLILLGRRVNLSPIIHPFRDSLREVEDLGIGQHFFFYDSWGRKRPFGFWLLHPMNWIVAGFMLGLLYILPLEAYGHFLFFAKALALTGLISILLMLLSKKLGQKLVRINAVLKRRDEERAMAYAEESFRRLYEERLAEVSCNGGEKRASLSSIKRPSARLRFEAVKAKVCKPYRWY